MAKKQPPTCPVCDAGTLKAHRYSDEFEYRGRTLKVDDRECWLCPACSADPIFPDQARRNHARYQDARRKSCGLLTSDEIAAIRKQPALTQSQAALIFAGGSNAFSKYERGDVIQSVAMDRPLRLASQNTATMEALKPLATNGEQRGRRASPVPGCTAFFWLRLAFLAICSG